MAASPEKSLTNSSKEESLNVAEKQKPVNGSEKVESEIVSEEEEATTVSEGDAEATKASDEQPAVSEEDDSANVSEGEDSTEETPKKKKQKKGQATDKQMTSGENDGNQKIGKRERKLVVNYVAESPVITPKKLDLDQGSGVPLQESEYISHMINVTKSEDLKFFHKILFGRPGSGNEIKKNIRRFKGYDFDEEDKKFQDLKGRIEKLKLKAQLAEALNIVGLGVSGKREELVERLALFLLSPPAVERDVSKKAGGKKRTVKTKPKKAGTKSRETKKRNASRKKNLSEPSESEADEESNSDAEEEEDEEEEDEKTPKRKRQTEESSDDELSEPEAKKKKENPSLKKKKQTKQKDSSDDGDAKPPVRRAKKAPKKKQEEEEEEEQMSDNSSDDELLIKKVKPSDEDIETFIKDYMKSVDLEEVTMKTIYKKVNEKYPHVDLADKKDFIKSTVKELLA